MCFVTWQKLGLGFLALFLILIGKINAQDSLTVSLTNGPVTGRLVTFDGDKYGMFKAIPFAEPPIGKLRFKVSAERKQLFSFSCNSSASKIDWLMLEGEGII